MERERHIVDRMRKVNPRRAFRLAREAWMIRVRP
jgi:hypothetical protein